MTAGEAEETVTCGGQKMTERRIGGGEGNMKPSLSFTTLSTIAIQAGQSQIVISVLKSGSVVHLQLVQVYPGLCEIGLNQEENQTLIQEQQQLLEKLKKHEKEVLAVVQKGRQREQRRRRDEEIMGQKKNRKQEEEEELCKAMEASLSEGWLLLLHLLERRQEVLRLASEFYCRAREFAVSIDRFEDLRIEPDSDRLADVQLTYDSMRKDLLGKSLQVLTSSSVLLQKLKRLQKIEAFQRRGGVLQDEEEDEESSQCSRGMMLRVEQLVESLQDRRRTADQAVRLRLQQVEDDIMGHKTKQESRQANTEDWSLTVDKILDQNLQSASTLAETTDLTSDCRAKENRDLQPESRLDVKPESESEEAVELLSQFRSEVQPRSGLDLKPESRSEQTRNVDLGFRSEDASNFKSKFKSAVRPGSRLHLKSPLKSDETRTMQSLSTSVECKDLQPGSRSDLKPGLRSEETKDLPSGSRSDLQPGSRLELKPESRAEESKNLHSEFKLNLKDGSELDLKLHIKTEETEDLQLQSTFDQTAESRSEVQPGSGSNVKPECRSEPTKSITPQTSSEETRNSETESQLVLKPEPRPDLKPGSRSEETKDLQPGSGLDQTAGSRSGVQPGPQLDVKPKSRSEETIEPLSEFQSQTQPRSGLDLKPGSRSKQTTDSDSGFRSEATRSLMSEFKTNVQPGLRLDLKSLLKLDETRDLHPGFRLELKPESRAEESRNLQSGFKLNLRDGPKLDLKLHSKTEETIGLQLESTLDHTPGSGSEVQPGSQLNLKPESGSEPTRDVVPGSRSKEMKNSQSESRLDLKPESRSELKPGSRSEETKELQPGSGLDQMAGSRSEVQPGPQSDTKPKSTSEPTRDFTPGSRSEETRNPDSGSISEAEDASLSSLGTKQKETKLHRAAATNTTSEQVAGLESVLKNETDGEEDRARQVLLTNQRQQLLSSCKHLVDKIWSWVQHGSSLLSNSSEVGQQLLEAEDILNRHLQLHKQAECAGQDAENMRQILDQITALHTELTSKTSEPSKQLSPLKALTEQLKRGSKGRTSTARPGPPAAHPADSLRPELASQIDLVLKELQSVNRKIKSNLQLLQPYVTFLRTAQQVEEEMEELRKIYMRRQEEEEETGEEEEKREEREAGRGNTGTTKRSPVKKQQVDACWQETLQRFLDAQELGNSYIHTVTTVSGAGLNLQSVVSVVQQTTERLCRIKQEVNELRSKQQNQIIQQQEYCKLFQERLLKTLQDLNCVSELLDSCTLMDLGSDLHTSKLLEHFKQARPHFKQLDAEVEYIQNSWETVRGVQARLEVEELRGGAVEEEDLSKLLKLQERVNKKIQQSESILEQSSSFHQTSQQLEALLQSDFVKTQTGSTGLCGSSEAELSQHKERQQQIQSLFKTASALKTNICTAVNHSGWTCFRVEQLEARLLSLDSLCASWLNEAARHEEKLRRDMLTCRLNDDINQLRDSFKELKKRFSNLKFNYLKRNDRSRNIKAVRNQLQQVELYEEKLQALRKRLQGVTGRLGSEVKNGAMAREAEDAINELQRQMGDFERNVIDHQKTLEMSRKLQQAMEEYQFWCEEASATITRVRKFSSECRSTEAVSVLYRQFEKFVWPTVPQQEERISQIAELAVRLHGVEEGQRYIEKTVSKHSEMVESIRELSDGLMKLEAKLKLDGLKKQQNQEETEVKKEGEPEGRRENEAEKKEESLKENRKMRKKEQTDNRSRQEAADMCELKETGHTPELAAEHDEKEVPVRRQTTTNRKPPLQKSCSQEADGQTVISESSLRQQEYSERFTSSYSSSHTLSLSCSPVEANRRIHAIHSQLLPVPTEPQATPPPSVTGPLFSDIQREFQRKEMQEPGQQGFSASCDSKMVLTQDASGGGLSEAELQQQEVMTEDSLSNDEYECASPDDISLPPLAETPESNMMQSDVEESFCFSSHSVHVNQYSRQCHTQSQNSGTGTSAVRQQRESSQTDSCPTPPTNLHSRFRSESSSFVQSPLAVPAPSVLTSTLCNILKTGETSTADVQQSTDLSLGGPDLRSPSGADTVHKSNTSDICYNNDNNVPEKRSPSQPEPILKAQNSQNNQPQMTTGIQGKISQYVASKEETLPQTDPIPKSAELNHNPTLPESSHNPQPLNDLDTDFNRGKTPSQHTKSLKYSSAFPHPRTAVCSPQSFPDSESCLHQDVDSSQTRQSERPVSKPLGISLTNTGISTVTQQTIYSQSISSESQCTLPQASSSLSSPRKSPLSQSDSLTQIDPALEAKRFAQSSCLTDSVHKDRTQEKTIPQNSNPPQVNLDSKSGLDQDVPSSQTSKQAYSVSMPQSSSKETATTVTQKHVNSQSSSQKTQCSEPQTSMNLRSQQGSHSSHSDGDLPDFHARILTEPNNYSNISISSSIITSSNRFSNKQNHQTVYSLHESMTSTCTQQCVHDPGINPSSPAQPSAPPQPESQTQALTQQANLHVTPLSSPPHLLTPDQDPNICQPMAIREEIRLTPQIQGPPLPAPPTLPQAQTESLPQGKASKPGHPCVTRPLSRATVMEGSPVMLEVEVTGHPEPTLTWFKDGEVSAPDQALACKDRKHFLFIPEASDSDGVLRGEQGVPQAAGNSCSSSDKWLLAEVFDIIGADWQTWFGTLCVLLWLLYLIVL